MVIRQAKKEEGKKINSETAFRVELNVFTVKYTRIGILESLFL